MMSVSFKLKTLLTVLVVAATLSITSAYAEPSVIFEHDANTVVLDEHHAETSSSHGEDAHGDDHGESEKAGLPQLDPAWFASQIFWLLITFSTMYAIFSKKILPELSTTLENRREHIQNDLDTAEELKEKAETAHQRYEELMSGAYQESRDLVHKNEEAMKKKYNKFMDNFRESSSEQLAALDKDLAKMKTKAKKDMNDMVADLATQAADKIAGVKANKSDMKSIIDSIDKKAA